MTSSEDWSERMRAVSPELTEWQRRAIDELTNKHDPVLAAELQASLKAGALAMQGDVERLQSNFRDDLTLIEWPH